MKYHIITENQRNFMISETPTQNNLEDYIYLLQKNSINLVINLTENNLYNYNEIKNANIDYLHFPIQDGNVPSDDKLKHLLLFLHRYNSIAFHCNVGLGRAPLILAICLIILINYKPTDVIEKIRKLEPRAFNNIQLSYLFSFKRNKFIESKCIIC